jgi:hypothetical protein
MARGWENVSCVERNDWTVKDWIDYLN